MYILRKEFEGIANHFQNHDHIRLILKYDESLSHSIYAASDMFIIPSIFEPCGITQIWETRSGVSEVREQDKYGKIKALGYGVGRMIWMRYGAIPIARKTGGLNDRLFTDKTETVTASHFNPNNSQLD
ncbi:hypothetical protein VNO77_23825 [Canavalia gladiata]|uniref:starch synthase n=1 Tax=Canavalia gladiata TaxID=3824 RepID=A0AAN9L8G4_CANGL